MRSWPLLLLAAPASVAVWSGWVGIGRMTGFGQGHPLPGLWDSLHLDTAVTLPVGVEAYAAYALRAWLSSSAWVSRPARRFAKWSAIGSLVLGMAGQVAYHLLTQAHAAHAPWAITTAVACLPVLVLGMGAALAHLLRADQSAERHAGTGRRPMVSDWPGRTRTLGPVRQRRSQARRTPDRGRRGCSAKPAVCPAPRLARRHGKRAARDRLAVARAIADRLAADGTRVSRRTLRKGGLRGSNAELGSLARSLTGEQQRQDRRRPAAAPPPV